MGRMVDRIAARIVARVVDHNTSHNISHHPGHNPKIMSKKYKKYILFLLVFAIIGQILFAMAANRYTTPHYESRIFATTGIEFGGSDLHKLNEGAHYFGQTMIGWTKFPSFKDALILDADLPAGTDINMHMQERQNIIFRMYLIIPICFYQLGRTESHRKTIGDSIMNDPGNDELTPW